LGRNHTWEKNHAETRLRRVSTLREKKKENVKYITIRTARVTKKMTFIKQSGFFSGGRRDKGCEGGRGSGKDSQNQENLSQVLSSETYSNQTRQQWGEWGGIRGEKVRKRHLVSRKHNKERLQN